MAAFVMSEEEETLAKRLSELSDVIEAKVKEIGDLKKKKAPKDEIMKNVNEMKSLREEADQIRKKIEMERRLEINKEKFDALMKGRFFFTPSFGLYGGVSGLYDLGPPGCAMKANTINLWRKHFIVNEGMLELDTTSVTPLNVLKASGHTAKFSDWMTREISTGACFRADHLIKDKLELLLQDKTLSAETREKYVHTEASLDEMEGPELEKVLRELEIKAPETNGELSEVFPFNLMFETKIGPTGKNPGFMRPETAQGLFMNFDRLLKYNGGHLPFAAACVGQAFRNEISPRAGLLRVLEFTLCEIEHFVDPTEKTHPKIDEVTSIKTLFYSRERQSRTPMRGDTMTIGEALEAGILQNQTLAYFIGRTTLFARQIGLKEGKFRFRQHKEKEMAHYACDCWDLEALTSYGWVECIGIADRSAFDLTVHSEASGEKLCFFKPYDKPVEISRLMANPEKGVLGKAFKKDAQGIIKHLATLDNEGVAALQKEMESAGKADITANGKTFSVTKDMVKFKEGKEKKTGDNIVPHVIEPSFGIGRILYAIWEQSFYIRQDKEKTKIEDQRGVLSLSPAVAPTTCLVAPLMVKNELLPATKEVVKILSRAGISHSEDCSGAAIGRRYARADEIGVSFALTIDYETLENRTVTLRERDTMDQVRVKIDDIASILKDLVDGHRVWDEDIAG
eukprot:CAMPEP_0201519810 /NCGR_PEP_ID=MMETSP0161_2-20130828/10260_1 /ASSEMBLY_ACC=CAM_ASM_000251 /TAXON_ID=180227 /ORGANISM="Neoparamoeba aestuarina, Strain SoJaBio B1-5/56/2" /LENGTH=681 /DNA_ID=CAMNT_0047917963 /DNA_START=179 /DNA_END=2224 /DNA_ORIENTATION=-